MFVYAKQEKNVISASLCATNFHDTSNVIDFYVLPNEAKRKNVKR